MDEKEYIEREPLKRDLIDRGFYPAIVKAAVEAAPVVDVVEVVHGEWKKRKNWRLYVCSACSHESDEPYRYCPNCGAKMDGRSQPT